jgi:hypothetical protein
MLHGTKADVILPRIECISSDDGVFGAYPAAARHGRDTPHDRPVRCVAFRAARDRDDHPPHVTEYSCRNRSSPGSPSPESPNNDQRQPPQPQPSRWLEFLLYLGVSSNYYD